jgi:hypothetical protein
MAKAIEDEWCEIDVDRRLVARTEVDRDSHVRCLDGIEALAKQTGPKD